MKHKITWELVDCIIKKENISSLLSKMEGFFEDAGISISFSNATSVEDVTLEEFEEYDFTNKQITELDIQLYKSGTMVWLESSLFGPYSIVLASTNDVEFSVLKRIIEEWIDSIKNKKRKMVIHFLRKDSICSFVILITMGVPAFGILIKLRPNLLSSFSPVLQMVLVCLACFPLSMFFAERIKECFPLTEVDIGENVEKNKRKRIWGVFTIVLAPLLINILSEIIKKLFL